MLNQVFSMTQEQIDALAETERSAIMQIVSTPCEALFSFFTDKAHQRNQPWLLSGQTE